MKSALARWSSDFLASASRKRQTKVSIFSFSLCLSSTSVFLSVSLFTRPFVFWRRLVLQGKKWSAHFSVKNKQNMKRIEKNRTEKKRRGRSLKIIFCILQQKFDFVKKIILFVRNLQTQNLKCRLHM